MNDIILTGGSGLLGLELRKLDDGIAAPPHEEFDAEDLCSMSNYLDSRKFAILIHAAALTSPPVVNQKPTMALRANILGTCNIVLLCQQLGLRLVYISTDYVFRGDKGGYSEDDELMPQNLYAWSKLGGECAVRLYANSLIIRTSFCESRFPYDRAFVDQYTSRDSVKKIAPIIYRATKDKDLTGILHIGTRRKSVKELAVELGKTDVGTLYREDVDFKVPHDTSFDLKKLEQYVNDEKYSS
jgi:dTDP-4-dehydrorhamnose reductase|tara:strand:+ start:1829 stop:2554 length:726 start_codon:yes stop_codon:yes gene_type:complete